MARKRKSPKGRIDGPTSVIRVHSSNGTIMLQLVWKCSKSVIDPKAEGKKIQREATITSNFVDPKNEDWIESALEICGGDSSLAACVFNFGLKAWTRQQETNDLGKVGEASKNLAKAIAAFTGLGLSAEQARAMVMASPEAASKIQNETFEQYVSKVIGDFATYQQGQDDRGKVYNRFPDVTKPEEKETTEGEAEEK